MREFVSLVSLDKLLNHSVPQFSHLKNGYDTTYF